MKNLISVLAAATVLFSMVTSVNADEAGYKKSCQACHAFGPGPKLGNKADWKARIATGMPAMVNNAIKGTAKGMPPKGGNMSLSDAQIKSIVEYMVKASK